MTKNRFAALGNILGGKSLSIKPPSPKYGEAAPTPTIAPPPIPVGVTPAPGGPGPMAQPQMPMTNVNALPNVGKVPTNLSRISKVGKIDHFPRLYKLLKS